MKGYSFSVFSKKELSLLPSVPGVYIFADKKQTPLYIGKAKNLAKRVKNHFLNQGFRESLYIDKVEQIWIIPTFSEILAFLKEAELIKKLKPKYNVMLKDDSSFFYVVITSEKFPRVIITHQPQKIEGVKIGPFVEGKVLGRTMYYLRKLYPFWTTKHSKKPCSWCRLGLCPGPNPDPEVYKNNIEMLKTFLRGKGEKILASLEKEIDKAGKNLELEKALELKKEYEKLSRVLENGKVLPYLDKNNRSFRWEKIKKALEELTGKRLGNRIEGFDLSTLYGKHSVCGMIVLEKGKVVKREYRLFKIKNAQNKGDTKMLAEVLERRLNHPEWKKIGAWFIDGGKAQLNTALKIRDKNNENFPVFSFAKQSQTLYTEKGSFPVVSLISPLKEFVYFLSWEAHNWTVSFHKRLRKKEYA